MEEQSLTELQNSYKSLLDAALPSVEIPDPTFFNISGSPHYEDVISNWYAFFLDTSNPHDLKTLFITSLMECYVEKSGTSSLVFAIENTKVQRERMVGLKRIDLLVYDEAIVTEKTTAEKDATVYRSAFIIENKINATLYNDLGLYYNGIAADNKYGIVLSIIPITTGHADFVNIMHQQLMERVTANIGKYMVKANAKYLILLKDFIQQIQSFTKTVNMKDTIDFYFENALKINSLIKLKEDAVNYIFDNIKLSLEGSGFSFARRYVDSLNIRFDSQADLFLTVNTNLIFTEGRYTINLWLSGKLAKSWNWLQLKEQLSVMIFKPADITFKSQQSGLQYASVAVEEVTVGLTKENIEKLPESLASHLKSHWVPFLTELVTLLEKTAVV